MAYIPLMSETIVAKAIRLAGGPTKLAAALGIKQPAVSQWDQVPAERVGKVSAITGIPPHELRPDLFPRPQQAAS
jgi:DNA-binding transcriptional regulator YdaS (Cro superfamily)